MVEVFGLLAGNCGENAQVHQQGTFSVKHHYLLVREPQGDAQRRGGRLAHRPADRQVALLVGAEVPPVPTRRPDRNHNGVATMWLKYPEYIRRSNHHTSPVDENFCRVLLYVSTSLPLRGATRVGATRKRRSETPASRDPRTNGKGRRRPCADTV